MFRFFIVRAILFNVSFKVDPKIEDKANPMSTYSNRVWSVRSWGSSPMLHADFSVPYVRNNCLFKVISKIVELWKIE